MPQNDLPGWLHMIGGIGLSGLGTWMGRLMWHAEETRAGRRRFWSRDLVLNLPVVAGMSMVSWGLAEYFGFGPGAASAIGCCCGWLGPRGIKALLELWLARAGRRP